MNSEQLILTLLSGFIGAIGGSIITIGFTIWRDNKEEKKNIAREKLGRVYGPILALTKKKNLRSGSKWSFPLSSNSMEVEIIDKMIFDYYYLLDEDLRNDFVLLHSELKNSTINQMKFPSLVDKIRKHYQENKKILGLR